MKAKLKSIEKMKYVYSKGNKVYMKANNDDEKGNWYPINFQWIPLVKLSSELIK